MSDIDEHGRQDPPSAADEAATLVGFLEYQRSTFAWKCEGLDHVGLTTTVATSSMTLGGMMKHLAAVEDYWFSYWFLGLAQGSPWNEADWDSDPDWEWHSAAHDSPEEIHSLWNDNVSRSRDIIDQALADGDAGRMSSRTSPDGKSPSLRWLLCHMIEEYARHNGHADIIRESIDGTTGE